MKSSITKQVILATKSIAWLQENQRQKIWYLKFVGSGIAEDWNIEGIYLLSTDK